MPPTPCEGQSVIVSFFLVTPPFLLSSRQCFVYKGVQCRYSASNCIFWRKHHLFSVASSNIPFTFPPFAFLMQRFVAWPHFVKTNRKRIPLNSRLAPAICPRMRAVRAFHACALARSCLARVDPLPPVSLTGHAPYPAIRSHFPIIERRLTLPMRVTPLLTPSASEITQTTIYNTNSDFQYPCIFSVPPHPC